MILTAVPARNAFNARRGDGGLHPGTASQITVQAGSNQTAVAGTATPIPPAVLVRDQLGQSVANVPLQFVVVGGSTASEVTTDAFMRANENPVAGNWSKAGGAATNLQLLTNSLRGVTANGEGLMYSTAVTWPPDQYSECQLLVGDPGGGGPAVRMLAGAESAYVAQATVGQVGLYKFVGGVFGNLQQVATAVASTDTLRLEVRGSTLRMYKNGVQLGTDVIDGSLTTGATGLDLYSNTTFTITRWAGGLPPTTAGTINPDTLIATDSTGIAGSAVWTLGTVPGVNTLVVTVPGLAGSPVTFTATGVSAAGQATQITTNAGNNQSAPTGTNVGTPPSVIVRDASNNPVAGVLVTFAIASGGGSLTGASQSTNASGIATVGSWTLGSVAGTNTLTASSAGLAGSPVTFTATGSDLGVTYFDTNFATDVLNVGAGTVGPFHLHSYNATAQWSFSTDYTDSGSTRSVKCVIPATGTGDDAGAVCAWFGHDGLAGQPLDPTLNQDLFLRVTFVIGPGSLANVLADDQLKVHKSVYGLAGSNVNGWVMSEYHPTEVSGKLFTEAERWGLNGTPFPWPAAVQEGHVYDVVYRFHRYTAEGAGTIRVWVDGTSVLDSPHWTYMGDPVGAGAQGLCLQMGAVYAQTTSGPVTVYLLSARATNFPIGAGTASPGQITFDFYVSPTGGTGAGTNADPWSLSYALSGAGGQLTAGKTVALRAGTYGSGGPGYAFTSTVAGTQANPIKFRNYPAERVIINGGILLAGSDVWFQGSKRDFVSTNTDHHTAGTYRSGFELRAPRVRVINVIVHDAGSNGIGNFQEATDSVVYGAIVYNCGDLTSNQDHGVYTTTLTAGVEKLLKHTLVFNNAAYGFHTYASGSAQYEYHVHHDGCLGFNNGCVSATGPRASLVVGVAVTSSLDTQIKNCLFYDSTSQTYYVIVLQGVSGSDYLLQDNYLVGQPQLGITGSLTFQRNRVYRDLRFELQGHATAYTAINFNNNIYRFRTNGGSVPFRVLSPQTNYATLAAWQAGEGLDTVGSTLTSTASGDPATGQDIYVLVNDYEPKQALIVVFNWALSGTVSVDLSTVFANGDSYQVYNVQDLFGTSVASGSFSGAGITLSMAGISGPAPLDRTYVTPPVTGPTFNVFLAHLA